MAGRLTDSAIDRESFASAIAEEVALVDPDPSWPEAFERERERLMAAFPDTFRAIEHIGSTSVPGLPSKAIVDLLAGVDSMDIAVAMAAPLATIGYTTVPGMNEALADRQFFMRHADGKRTHHLHLVAHDTPAWHERIRFRDRLRNDPALRNRYVALKRDLATRFSGEREAYTQGKSAFILAASEP